MTEEAEWPALTADLQARRAAFERPHGATQRQKASARGRLLARERIAALCDPDSFHEYGLLAQDAASLARDPAPPGRDADGPPIAADGVVTGVGTIRGVKVCLVADDGLYLGGSRGAVGERKVARMRRLALERGLPYIALQEGSASRIADAIGVVTATLGRTFVDQIRLRDRVPTVGAVLGSCFGGPAFLAAMSDYAPMVRDSSYLAMSGPPVVRAGTGHTVDQEEIGGYRLQAERNGIADLVAPDERSCLAEIRRFLDLVAVPWRDAESVDPAAQRIEDVVPTNFRRPYDIHEVLAALIDAASFVELKASYARNIVTGLARLAGRSVGLIASQPNVLAGTLDVAATRKVRAFVELCDRRRVPIVFLQDVPGFLVGPSAEQDGQLREAVALLESVLRASVAKITVIMRKSYGLSHLALGGREFGADFTFAWPLAELGMMGPQAAARVVHGPGAGDAQIRETAKELQAEMNIYAAAGWSYIDDVIAPQNTRRTLIAALDDLLGPRPGAGSNAT